MKIQLFVMAIFLLSSFVSAQQQVLPSVKKVPYKYSLRGVSKPLKSSGLFGPGDWLILASIAADGSYVKKGEVVATFDASSVKEYLTKMSFDEKLVKQSLDNELVRLGNVQQTTQDSLDTTVDKLNFLKATLEKDKKVPLRDDVLKAEGRLRIAQLEYSAAETELQKAKRRYNKNFISKTEYDLVAQTLLEEKAELEFAELDLKYVKLPTPATTMEMTSLTIKNTELKKADLEYELSEMAVVQGLEKKLAASRGAALRQRIEKTEKALDKTIVKAPVSGYLRYLNTNAVIAPGRKLYRGSRFAEIPELDSMVFEVFIPQDTRKFFKEGDNAQVYVSGRKGEPLSGVVQQIYNVPVDIAEKKTVKYGKNITLTGLKVYRAEIKLLEKNPWLRPGMSAAIELSSQQQLEVASVPVKYLKVKDEKKFLAFNGIYKEVFGFANQGLFFIEKGDYPGKVTLQGEFGQPAVGEDGTSLSTEDINFVASGEILPIQSEEIIVGDIGHAPAKIMWLQKEETSVEKGDELFRLDTEALEEEVLAAKTTDANMQNIHAKQQQKLAQLKRTNDSLLKQAKNLLRIEEIKRDIVLRPAHHKVKYNATISGKMKVLKARIAKEAAIAEHLRLKSKNPAIVSRVELEKAARKEKRAILQLEVAEISYAKIERGSSEDLKSQAEQDYLVQKVAYENLQRRCEFSLQENEREMKRLQISQVRHTKYLERLSQRVKNTTVVAPSKGLIRYNKIYDGGRQQKISPGSSLRSRMVAMELPDLSTLVISIKVPERYFAKLKLGLGMDIKIPSIGDQLFKGEVVGVDYLFESLAVSDEQLGLYSSKEPLGENIFTIRVKILDKSSLIKPGVVADVYFPFLRRSL